MHTPEQATKLWCPMVRLAACKPNGDVSEGQTVMNRLQNGVNIAIPDAGRCIAEKCAMWRWVPKFEEPKPLPKPSVGRGVTFLKPLPPKPVMPTHGYCGLAGRGVTA